MKYSLIFFLCLLNVTSLDGQIEIRLKTGVQMLGMFRSSANIFGDGQKVFNPSYGLSVGHKVGKDLTLSLDADFTSGNYHSLVQKQSIPLHSENWNHANYSLINTSVLLSYKFNEKFGVKSGFHVFFMGKITTEFNAVGTLVTGNFVFLDTYSSSRAIGVPIAIAFEKNRFELEVKWIGGVNKFLAKERGYRRLETFSINIGYSFKSKK